MRHATMTHRIIVITAANGQSSLMNFPFFRFARNKTGDFANCLRIQEFDRHLRMSILDGFDWMAKWPLLRESRVGAADVAGFGRGGSGCGDR